MNEALFSFYKMTEQIRYIIQLKEDKRELLLAEAKIDISNIIHIEILFL